MTPLSDEELNKLMAEKETKKTAAKKAPAVKKAAATTVAKKVAAEVKVVATEVEKTSVWKRLLATLRG